MHEDEYRKENVQTVDGFDVGVISGGGGGGDGGFVGRSGK